VVEGWLADLRQYLMTNISITLLCNRSCSYCFARSLSKDIGHMAPEIFAQALDHICRSGIGQARLLGGEPTIHPHFAGFVDAIEERGLDLLLFSNGCMPQKAVDRLGRFPRERLSILLNIHPPDTQSDNEWQRVRRICSRFNSSIMLGCNIHAPRIELDFLRLLIREFGLIPKIRLGLAHPCIGAENRFLHPRHYRTVGDQIGAFAHRAGDEGVRLELDCGFVPCMFSEDDLQLLSESGEAPGRRCNPLPDFLPDGRFIPCYPLAKIIDLDSEKNCSNDIVQATLADKLAAYRTAGIYSDCSVCGLREQNLCYGGCLAAALKRLRHIPFAVQTHGCRKMKRLSAGTAKIKVIEAGPDINDQTLMANLWTIPYIDQPRSFWQEINARFGPHIREVYVPLPDGEFPSGRPVQKTDFLHDFLRNSPLPLAVLLNPVALPGPVDKLAPAVIDRLRRLRDTTNLKSVTIADYTLALRIKEKLPDMPLTASVLMDIARQHQAALLNGVCDTLVPASRIMRDYSGLKAIRQAFHGKIRLMVNESCLPDCLCRTQHFTEMASVEKEPQSLCRELLERNPWMRLTGAWVLPQHLHFFAGVVDEMKLAGRVTLQNPEKYLQVLEAYISRIDLTPDRIGGGPASVLSPLSISGEFYGKTLHCGKQCHSCTECRAYYQNSVNVLLSNKEAGKTAVIGMAEKGR
jgi:hypothetical protein